MQSAIYDAELRPAILAIGTALPPHQFDQRAVADWMAALFADRPAVARLVQSLHRVSGIETRYSCNPDYLLPAAECSYAPGQSEYASPTTQERMTVYAREAPPVGADAARRALANFARTRGMSSEQAAATITQLVVVSCTGFFAPGLDFALTQELGLAPTVNRTLIGFMGCSAMFNGLRVASQAVEADPNACALVVSVELCSLHSQPESRPDLLVAASLFGDGASACVVGLPAVDTGDYFRLEEFLSMIKPDTIGEMVWTIGNRGFELHLSPRIPAHLVEAAPQSLQRLFGDTRPAFWAIHPGGRAIVDGLADIFALEPEQIRPSREVLRRVGNLSSATILFVLDEIRRQRAQVDNIARADNGAFEAPAQGVAMAFGPGLVIEMARLTYVAEPAVLMPMAAEDYAPRMVKRK